MELRNFSLIIAIILTLVMTGCAIPKPTSSEAFSSRNDPGYELAAEIVRINLQESSFGLRLEIFEIYSEAQKNVYIDWAGRSEYFANRKIHKNVFDYDPSDIDLNLYLKKSGQPIEFEAQRFGNIYKIKFQNYKKLEDDIIIKIQSKLNNTYRKFDNGRVSDTYGAISGGGIRYVELNDRAEICVTCEVNRRAF